MAAAQGDPAELLNQAIERHYALRQYGVEVRTSTVSGDRLQSGHRVRITVDEEARAFRSESLSGDRAEVVSNGEWLWVRTRRSVSEHPAEFLEFRGRYTSLSEIDLGVRRINGLQTGLGL